MKWQSIKRPLAKVDALSLLVVLALTSHSYSFAQTPSCVSATCIYIPIAANPIPVSVPRWTTRVQDRTGYPTVFALIANGTNETLQTIDMQLQLDNLTNDEIITETRRYSLTVLPGQVIPFFAWHYIPGPMPQGFISIHVITWTSVISSVYQHVPVTSVATGMANPFQTYLLVTTTIQNTSTQILRDVQLKIWSDGTFGNGNCGAECLSFATVNSLLPGEIHTTVVLWRGPGFIPASRVLVASFGAVSP